MIHINIPAISVALLVMGHSGGSGFPVGGRGPRGGVHSRGGYVSKILYVKMKESGPLGGVRRVHPLDPSMGQ